MAGDPYKSVKSGDPLQVSATAWNTLMQLARQAGERGALGSADIAAGQRDLDVVTLKNVTNTDCPRWGILGIDVPIFAPTSGSDIPRDFSASVAMRGVLATTPGYAGKWAIALEPIAAGKFGRAALSGVVPAIINVPSGTTPLFAEASGSVYARAGSSGSAQVLWCESGSGNRHALLRMGAASQGAAAKATVTAIGGSVGFYTCTVGTVAGVTVENLYESGTGSAQYYGTLAYAPTGVTIVPQRLPVGSSVIAVRDGSAWFTCAPTAFQVTCA